MCGGCGSWAGLLYINPFLARRQLLDWCVCEDVSDYSPGRDQSMSLEFLHMEIVSQLQQEAGPDKKVSIRP